jgi:hypothetical protein
MMYAGTLEKALWETGARINSVLVIQSIASILMIAISFGLVSYPTEVPVLGVKLGMSLPVLMSGGAVATGSLLMYQLGLVHHEQELLTAILDIYKSSGLAHSSLSQRVASPIENPGVVTTIVSMVIHRSNRREWFNVIRAFVLSLFVGLPLFSQLVVLVVLGAHRAWLATAAVGASLAASCVFTSLYFRGPHAASAA